MPETLDGIWLFAVLVHMSKDIARDIVQQTIVLLKP